MAGSSLAGRRAGRVERSIYGQILAASLVVVLSEDKSLSSQQLLVWLVVTLLVFWLAHAYSDVIAARVERERRPLATQVRRSLRLEWPVAQAGILPGLALAAGWTAALSTKSAVDLAIGVAVLQLALWGLALARRSHLGPLRTIAVIAMNAGFGLALIGLKVFVH